MQQAGHNMMLSNDDVQWNWTLLSQCIESEDNAIELLCEIVKLWVTIRGFSLATWLKVGFLGHVLQTDPQASPYLQEGDSAVFRARQHKCL